MGSWTPRVVMRPEYYESGPSFQPKDVLAALNDRQCRAIIQALQGEQKTANGLADELAIPLSSLYRKLNTLADASLLETSIEIRVGGKHVTRYSIAFDTVTVTLDGREVEVDIARPASVAG